MRSLLKWCLILGVVVGLGGAIAIPTINWWKKRSQTNYLTAEVTRGDVQKVVNSTGTVQPVRSVMVGAFVSGPIQKVHVDFNSIVKEGDILARIDPRLLQSAVDRDKAMLATQRAELARVEALLQQAKNDELRANQLRAAGQGFLAETEMDQLRYARLAQEAQRQLAEAGIAQAEATLKNSQANLEYAEIRSPVDGIIIDRKVDPGQTVASSFQTPELFVVAPDMHEKMHIFADVDEADIGLIRQAQEEGRSVQFTVDSYPNDLFTGRIYQIRKNGTETQSVITYPVVIETANPNLKLMPGMTANITFSIDETTDVIRVPTAALRFVPKEEQVHPDDRHHLDVFVTSQMETDERRSASEKAALSQSRQKRIVWVQEGQFLRAVPVMLGMIENRWAELVEGELEEGQVLVTGEKAVVRGK